MATAIVTPFNQDGSINYDSLKNLIDFQIKSRVDAIVVCATTGEASTLSYNEHIKTVEFCCEYVSGRIPVIAGAGSNDTSHAIKLSKKCSAIGVNGLLLVTPYYNKCSQDGLVEHYFKIADSVSAPIIVYNVPQRTGLNILPKTYEKLSKHDNIVAVKEANGNISSIAKTIALCKDDLCIYSGNDDQTLPILSLGGRGVISVVSNIIPDVTSKLCHYFLQGDIESSRKMQLEYLELCEAVFYDINPMPIKYALNLMGYNVGNCRLPLTSLNNENRDLIRKCLEKYRLIGTESP